MEFLQIISVESLLMDTSLKQTPLYYGLFPLCPKKFSLIEKKNLYKLYAGSLIWTVDTKCRPQRAKSWYKLDLSITDALVTRCWHIVLSVSELLHKHQCFIDSSSTGVLKIKIHYIHVQVVKIIMEKKGKCLRSY